MIKKKKNKKKILIIILCSIVVLLLLIIGSVMLYIHHLYGKLNVKPSSDSISISSSIAADDNNEQYDDWMNDDELSDLERDILKNLNNSATPVAYDENVYNVLLIGVDSRENNIKCRSDSMILVSINKSTKKIIMTSFLRDIYISIPDCGFNRLNAANAFGGPQLLLDTIESNFKIKIDRYAVVNFYSFMDLIDAAGGVTVNVSDSEKTVANKYIHELNRLLGLNSEDGLITSTGDLKLTGKQALGYARNRYTGSDFDRTDRQREILDSLFNALKGSKITDINDYLNKILPEITTNVSEGEIYSLILSLPSIKNYEVVQIKIPMKTAYKGVMVNGMSVLNIDYSACINELKSVIYNES